MNIPYTRRAIQILRRAQALTGAGLITQAHNIFGGLDQNGHGRACATQVLFEFLDDLRGLPSNERRQDLLDTWLPVTSDQIISWNDTDRLSFEEIAERILDAAGGDEAIEHVPA